MAKRKGALYSKEYELKGASDSKESRIQRNPVSKWKYQYSKEYVLKGVQAQRSSNFVLFPKISSPNTKGWRANLQRENRNLDGKGEFNKNFI